MSSADENLKYAWDLYYKGVAAEGSTKRTFLQQALNVLELVPAGYKNRDDLESRIKPML